MKAFAGCIFVLVAQFCALAALGQTQCPAKSASRTFDIRDTADTVEGPICVKVRFNALRYTVSLTNAVTVSAGPDLTTATAAAQKAGGSEVDRNPGQRVDGKQDNPLQKIKDELANIEATSGGYPSYTSDDDSAANTLTSVLAALSGLVDSSDQLFARGGPKVVVSAAQLTMQSDGALKKGEHVSWKPTDLFKTQLLNLQARVSRLQAGSPSQDDATDLKNIQAAIANDLNMIAPYLNGGDKTNSFYKQLSIFSYWNSVIRTLNEGDFTAERYIPCRIILNQSKQNAITVSGVDNFPRFAGQATTAVATNGPVANVTCTTPFAISAGVDFSFLKSPTFGIVPTGTAGTNQFEVTNDGGVNPMPIAMAHWMLQDFGNHRYGVYGSFGAAVHAQSSSAGSTSVEYLGGISLGFFRTALVTAGWHLGEVSSLGGGYKVGDPVPSSVTTVPLTSSYKSGFGLAITFTKP